MSTFDCPTCGRPNTFPNRGCIACRARGYDAYLKARAYFAGRDAAASAPSDSDIVLCPGEDYRTEGPRR